MHRSIAVAVGYDAGAAAGLADQPAVVSAGNRGPGHRAGGVAGNDLARGEPPHQPAEVGVSPASRGDRRRGVAGADDALVVSHQTTHEGAAASGGYGSALHVAGGHRRSGTHLPYQNAGVAQGAHSGRQHPHIPDHPAVGQVGEQSAVEAPGGDVDRQIGDGMALAVKRRGILPRPPDRRPVGVGVGGGYAAASVGVEIQVGRKLVALAGCGAAHPRTRRRQIPAGERPGVGDIFPGGARQPVAVQVVADGVQLVQGIDVNQVVVVGVVIHHRRPLRRGVGRGVLAGRAEVPGVVGESVAVQIDVPVGVNPGVRRGRLQLRGGLPRGGVGGVPHARQSCVDRGIAIAVGYRRRAGLPPH